MKRWYGVYRERPRSAVLATIMLHRRSAQVHANRMADQCGGAWCVAATAPGQWDLPEVIYFGKSGQPQVIHRAGDWDSRSPWQPRFDPALARSG
jgi:hypothetical protein